MIFDRINDKIGQMATTIGDIRQAIINKGVDVPQNAGLSEFPDYVRQIQGFSGEGLASVAHDDSLQGLGTLSSPLSIRVREKYQTSDFLRTESFLQITPVSRSTIMPYRTDMRAGDLICDKVGSLAYIESISGDNVNCAIFLVSKLNWENIGGSPKDNYSFLSYVGDNNDFIIDPGSTFVAQLNKIYEAELYIEQTLDSINGLV